jgi:SAM-dependent methyltransferase
VHVVSQSETQAKLHLRLREVGVPAPEVASMAAAQTRADIAYRNPGGPADGWVDEAWFLAEPMQGLSPGVEVGPEHRKACLHAIGIGPGGSAVDVRGVAEALPFPAGSLAFAVANHVLEHCFDPVAVLREWRRALRHGGGVGVVVPDSRYVDTFSLNPEHKHLTTPEVLRNWFGEAGGYEIVREATPVPRWSCGLIAVVSKQEEGLSAPNPSVVR